MARLLGLIVPVVLGLVITRASPSGKARASQARMRGFESRRPLQALLRPVSSSEAGLFCRHAWWALITDCLRKQGLASRSQIDTVVFPALSTELSEEQKRNKVKNLLAQLSREQEIRYEPKGDNRGWRLG